MTPDRWVSIPTAGTSDTGEDVTFTSTQKLTFLGGNPTELRSPDRPALSLLCGDRKYASLLHEQARVSITGPPTTFGVDAPARNKKSPLTELTVSLGIEMFWQQSPKSDPYGELIIF